MVYVAKGLLDSTMLMLLYGLVWSVDTLVQYLLL
jgi:hypothetical protein